LARVLDNVRNCSYEPKIIASKLSTIENLETRLKELQENVAIEERRLNKVFSDSVESEQRLCLCQQRLGLYDELEKMGCGLNELNLLRNTILEMSVNNNIYHVLAFKKFFKDIEDQYDVKLGFEQKIEEMEKLLIRKKQEFHNVSLECSRAKDVHDKLNELFSYGVTQNDIICWNNIVKGYTKDLSGLNEDLSQYGSLTNSKTKLFAKVESLTSECEKLSAKVDALREEGEKLSQSIGLQMSLGTKWIQAFSNDVDAKIKELRNFADESILSVREQSSSVTGQAVKSLQILDTEVRKELDLFQKIGATAEFSPLIKAARGQYVDHEELKWSVIRAMGIMHSKLNSTLNGGTKDALQRAIASLESEMIFS
jgi:hypothetical protein